MSRAPLWRAVAAFAVVAISLFLALTSPAKLGLDLKGGTQIVLETKDTGRVKADAEATDRALSVLRGRVDALGVAEPTLARSGEKRIIVELPGAPGPARGRDGQIGQTAQLIVPRGAVAFLPPDDRSAAKGEQLLDDEDGNPIVVGPTLLDGNGVSDADGRDRAAEPRRSGSSTSTSTAQGRGGWKQLVGDACANPNAGNRVAIVLDDQGDLLPRCRPRALQRRRRQQHAASAADFTAGDGQGPRRPDQGRRTARSTSRSSSSAPSARRSARSRSTPRSRRRSSASSSPGCSSCSSTGSSACSPRSPSARTR